MWNKQKAIEAILYVANRIQEPTGLRILKVLYLADRLHLSRYGRFILRDTYVAMGHGPVAIKTYNLLREEGITDFSVGNGQSLIPPRDADVMEFSITDGECLDEIIRGYGQVSTDTLIAATQDRIWKEISEEGVLGPNGLPMPIERIADGLENAAEVRNHLDYLREEGYL